MVENVSGTTPAPVEQQIARCEFNRRTFRKRRTRLPEVIFTRSSLFPRLPVFVNTCRQFPFVRVDNCAPRSIQAHRRAPETLQLMAKAACAQITAPQIKRKEQSKIAHGASSPELLAKVIQLNLVARITIFCS